MMLNVSILNEESMNEFYFKNIHSIKQQMINNNILNKPYHKFMVNCILICSKQHFEKLSVNDSNFYIVFPNNITKKNCKFELYLYKGLDRIFSDIKIKDIKSAFDYIHTTVKPFVEYHTVRFSPYNVSYNKRLTNDVEETNTVCLKKTTQDTVIYEGTDISHIMTMCYNYIHRQAENTYTNLTKSIENKVIKIVTNQKGMFLTSDNINLSDIKFLYNSFKKVGSIVIEKVEHDVYLYSVKEQSEYKNLKDYNVKWKYLTEIDNKLLLKAIRLIGD